MAADKKTLSENAQDITGTDITDKPQLIDAETKRAFIESLCARVAQIPQGQDMIAFLKAHNVDIRLDESVKGGGVMSYLSNFAGEQKTCTVLLPADLIENPDRAVADLVHEMRHVYQAFAEHFDIKAGLARIEDQCWYLRVLEADAEATAVDFAYQLSKVGDGAVLEDYLTNKRKDMVVPQAMAHSYTEALAQGADCSAAKRQAFDKFFNPSYRAAVDTYDASVLMGEYNTAVYFERHVQHMEGSSPDKVFRNVGFEKKYLCSDDPEKIKAWLFKIGTLDQGDNYLTLPGTMPLDDKIYRGMFAPDMIKVTGQVDQMVREICDRYKKAVNYIEAPQQVPAVKKQGFRPKTP